MINSQLHQLIESCLTGKLSHKKYIRVNVHRTYGQYTTPYEKLKETSEEQHEDFLNKDVSFEDLDKIAYNMSDNEFAVLMRKQQNELFDINSLLKSQ